MYVAPHSNCCIHSIGCIYFVSFSPFDYELLMYTLCLMCFNNSSIWHLSLTDSSLNEYMIKWICVVREGECFKHQGSIQRKRGEGERHCCAHWSEFYLLHHFICGWAFVSVTTWAEFCVLKVRPLICNPGCYLQNP